MAELVNLANGRVDLLFHEVPKNFKRNQSFSHRGIKLCLKVDKNDSIYDVLRVEGTQADQWQRDLDMFNLVKGCPTEIALCRIKVEIDYILDE